MHSQLYSAPRLAAHEELKVCTMLWGWHWSVKSNLLLPWKKCRGVNCRQSCLHVKNEIQSIKNSYEGISRSSQTELIMKYTPVFVVGHCCLLQSTPFKVYAMGPGFLPLLEPLLELTFWNHTYESVIVPEFQQHPWNCSHSCDLILRNKNK
jgi:hypothetical protein